MEHTISTAPPRRDAATSGSGGSARRSAQSERHGAEPESRGTPKRKEEVGWRKIVRNFMPSWFAVNMGTGIVSILLHQLPYNMLWIRDVSIVFFVLNIVLFCVFLITTILRYVLYPEIWTAMIRHPAQSLFVSCLPMGLATIINMIVLVCAPWGQWAVYLAWALWWIDVSLAVALCIFMPFPVMRHHKLELHRTTATLLFLFVPMVVASATGGLVAAALADRGHALLTLTVSYVLWGAGVSFAFIVLAMYFQRLTLHNLPPREAIVSVFLPVGPLGQGGFAIQQLGRVALDRLSADGTLAGANTSLLAQVFYANGLMLALAMWGAGLCWIAFAMISIANTRSFPFNMGWWGFTFPLGTLASCTGLLAQDLNSGFLRVLTMIFSISVFLLWLMVAFWTVIQIVSGEVFSAPCLKDLKPKDEHEEALRSVW